MATPGQLVTKLSTVLKISEATLTVYDRALRDAGLLTKAGRGRGSAQRTPLDTARMLIALLATPFPARAAQAALDFGRLVHHETEIRNQEEWSFLDLWPEFRAGATFEDAFAALLSLPGSLPGVRITVRDTMLNAVIDIEGTLYVFGHPSLIQMNSIPYGSTLAEEEARAKVGAPFFETLHRYSGIKTERTIATSQIKPIAQFICGMPEDENL